MKVIIFPDCRFPPRKLKEGQVMWYLDFLKKSKMRHRDGLGTYIKWIQRLAFFWDLRTAVWMIKWFSYELCSCMISGFLRCRFWNCGPHSFLNSRGWCYRQLRYTSTTFSCGNLNFFLGWSFSLFRFYWHRYITFIITRRWMHHFVA